MSKKERLIKIIKVIIDDLSSQVSSGSFEYNLRNSGYEINDLLSDTEYVVDGNLSYAGFKNYIKGNSKIFSLYGIVIKDGQLPGYPEWEVITYNGTEIESI